MNKETLLNKAKEIISKSDIRDLSSDYESSNNVIKFKDDSGVDCRISFNYKFFGIVSYIDLRRDWLQVLRFNLTKSEYRELTSDIKNREKEIKQSELEKVFKDVNREEKLNQVL